MSLLLCWLHAWRITAAQENGGDDADIQRAYQTAMNRWQAVLHEEALAAAVSRVPAARARPRSADTPVSGEAGAAAEEQPPVRALMDSDTESWQCVACWRLQPSCEVGARRAMGCAALSWHAVRDAVLAQSHGACSHTTSSRVRRSTGAGRRSDSHEPLACAQRKSTWRRLCVCAGQN